MSVVKQENEHSLSLSYQDQNSWLLDNGSCDGDPLFLTSTQYVAAWTDVRIIT